MSILKDLHKLRGNKRDSLGLIKANKELLISEKKRMIKYNQVLKLDNTAKRLACKRMIAPQLENVSSLDIKDGEVFIVGNSTGFFDGHEDVSLKGSWTKTAQEQGERIPIVKDHEYKIDNLYAKNIKTVVTNMSIRSLGYDMDGEREVIGAIISPYSKDIYQKYVDGVIRQHSMGLEYVKIVLAINDPGFEEEYKNYQRYADQIVNREAMEEVGYFWGVQEQKAREFSSVVFGSNPFTPAYTNKSLKGEPSKDTLSINEPIKSKSFYQHLISNDE